MTVRGVLGAGEYSVTLREAWSGRVLWQTTDQTQQTVTWRRERNATTQATVVALMRPDVAHRLEPWVHLMSVYRNDLLVWHGVVMTTRVSGTRAEITAADGSVLFSRRRVPHNRTWAQHDATQVMRTMVEDACGYADVTGLVEAITARESRLWVTAGWTAAECMLSDVVAHLEELGLVWCVNAGRLLIGPVAAEYTTAQVTDHHVDGQITVVKDGSEVVTDALVVGKGVWGQYTVGSTPVGLVQSIEKADGLVRAEECEQQAERVVRDAKVAPRRVEVPSGSRLLPTAPVTIEELVPGVRVPVSTRQTGVVIGSVMQITEVEVTADASGEEVSVTFSEVNASDVVAELPDPADLDWRSPYEKELAASQHTGTGSGAAGVEGQDEVAVPPV
ncbi:hypothetical protein B842_03275 [Corynebacterium humireducens NBRC 106098 = DSM 45392]|uniref:Minor tail protein n=1 Tax=Corynebacterium humireducens NBRC 106098 = DSM 45392 TaxID=1223515 RepID=A0A0B5D8F9_9CORY|nr:hypothetical protein [Corynebacterium humireducens]AJE32508.1 hypothetical protein B842_03275 [Corynebacterium humireducens NBRC 106098 = DSM 45392]